MNDFWTYFNSGLHHILNLYAYEHILFLSALAVPYESHSWKKLLILVSLFTLGHTLSMLLSVFNIVTVHTGIINILILIAIFIMALRNIVFSGKSTKKNTFPFLEILTSLIGILHGLGFSGYFNRILKVNPTDKLLPLFESALGMLSGQIIVVAIVLLMGFVVQTLFKFSKRDWTLTLSAFIVGILVPMILQNDIWNK
ncbi:MAG: HupE/UreJ family protein [Flavobacterium sp.]